MTELKPCPFCGGVKGYYSSHRLTKYYDANGNESVISISGIPAKYVHCISCGKRISLDKLRKERLNK